MSDLSDLATVALLVAVLAQSVTVLLGEVFYSGAVALLIARTQPGGRPSLLGVARSLSYGRLIAVDLLFGLGIAVGLVLFVVPGVVAFTWFALAGPLVELDGVGVGPRSRAAAAWCAAISGRCWPCSARSRWPRRR